LWTLGYVTDLKINVHDAADPSGQALFNGNSGERTATLTAPRAMTCVIRLRGGCEDVPPEHRDLPGRQRRGERLHAGSHVLGARKGHRGMTRHWSPCGI